MKKILAILMAATMVACMCSGCGSSSDSSKAASTAAKVCPIEIVSEKFIKVHNPIDTKSDPTMYVAELKNTSNNSVTVSKPNVDVYDSNDNLIGNMDVHGARPAVIKPGESAVISEDASASLASATGKDNIPDSAFNHDKLHFSYQNYHGKALTDVEVIDPVLSTSKDGDAIVSGKVKNNGSNDLTDICVFAHIRDKDGNIVDAIEKQLSLGAGEEQGFNMRRYDYIPVDKSMTINVFVCSDQEACGY